MKIEEDSAQVRLPPPLLYLGFLLLGFVAELGIDLRTLGIGSMLRWGAGALLFAGGVALVASAIGLFKRAGTPAPPWTTTTGIVTTGVYGHTRNPMYIGMALIYAGLAVGLDGPIALILLPLVMVIIRTQVIAREERYLDAKFGQQYRAYKARVRRWL
ncbi:isoprenylcysteine carboxylmethyltransferase family protein [Sphingosinicella sp. CPCC 101087]|uniref:methyltransferase family protein n=1 Tax=Sphingosinicella sp. CPCC 101087 TaxID=2497754 RepID=UPI00101C99B7|nr:isoprenylcysteine carboxylmethyltransferase family protein [Sphingosinicella sp. CPCC 101087]